MITPLYFEKHGAATRGPAAPQPSGARTMRPRRVLGAAARARPIPLPPVGAARTGNRVGIGSSHGVWAALLKPTAAWLKRFHLGGGALSARAAAALPAFMQRVCFPCAAENPDQLGWGTRGETAWKRGRVK